MGGLEQIGMNITAFEYGDEIVVVDCGLAFPGDEMLGIDLVIPDVSYLKKNAVKVKGFCFTHGHEDHIGSLPYVLKELNVPIYGSRLAIGLIENKLKEHNLLKTTQRNCVKSGDMIDFGKIKVEFIRSNHSISDAFMLAIHTPAGVVVHTGDFKIDYAPIHGETVDLQRIAELGKKGVLLLMADSTNAERPGFTKSESSVGKALDDIYAESEGSRIIVATFASNVDRVQQIITAAMKYNRKVVVEGRSMVNVTTTALDLGYLKVPEDVFIDIDEINKYEPGRIVIVTTGSQGEPMAALSRMAGSTHKKIQICKGDKVILSSKPIPGNEKTVSRVINDLFRKGADVIFENAHVSGHACQEELKILHTLVKPKYFMPVHGEFRHLIKHAALAKELGMADENIFIMSSGDVLEINHRGGAVTGRVPANPIMVDGLGVGDVGNIVLRDRQKLSQDGLIIVVVTLKKQTGEIIAGPDIVSRGFVYVRESGDLMIEAREVVNKALANCGKKNINDWSKIKNHVKESLNEYLWQQMKRSPMILPIIMEV